MFFEISLIITASQQCVHNVCFLLGWVDRNWINVQRSMDIDFSFNSNHFLLHLMVDKMSRGSGKINKSNLSCFNLLSFSKHLFWLIIMAKENRVFSPACNRFCKYLTLIWGLRRKSLFCFPFFRSFGFKWWFWKNSKNWPKFGWIICFLNLKKKNL